jgi:hypothetical protein
MPESLKSSSYKSMSNILSAYEEVNDDKREQSKEDESFLIKLTYSKNNLAKNTKNISRKLEILKNLLIYMGLSLKVILSPGSAHSLSLKVVH